MLGVRVDSFLGSFGPAYFDDGIAIFDRDVSDAVFQGICAADSGARIESAVFFSIVRMVGFSIAKKTFLNSVKLTPCISIGLVCDDVAYFGRAVHHVLQDRLQAELFKVGDQIQVFLFIINAREDLYMLMTPPFLCLG